MGITLPFVHKRNEHEVGGQAVLGRQSLVSTPWLTERHGYDPTFDENVFQEKRLNDLYHIA